MTQPSEVPAAAAAGLEFERQRLAYEQAASAHAQLTDIRFKLLAFVGAFTAVAIPFAAGAGGGEGGRFLIALVGLALTLGAVAYDVRNTAVYAYTAGYLQRLERALFDSGPALPGPYHRPPFEAAPRLFGVRPTHGRAVSLVYGAALGAWVFAALFALWDDDTGAPLIGLAVAVACVLHLEHVDYQVRTGVADRRTWRQRTERARTAAQAQAAARPRPPSPKPPQQPRAGAGAGARRSWRRPPR